MVARDSSEVVLEFDEQLRGFVGRRVRFHLRDGRTVAGTLSTAPTVFNGIDPAGTLVKVGVFYLSDTDEAGAALAGFSGKLEDIVTYDVLPRNSRSTTSR